MAHWIQMVTWLMTFSMCNCAVNWCDKLRFLHLFLYSRVGSGHVSDVGGSGWMRVQKSDPCPCPSLVLILAAYSIEAQGIPRVKLKMIWMPRLCIALICLLCSLVRAWCHTGTQYRKHPVFRKHPLTFSEWCVDLYKQQLQWIYSRKGRFWQCRN